MTKDEQIKRLKKLRCFTGYTREAFSEYTGIPLQTLSNWESGRRLAPDYIITMLEINVLLEFDNKPGDVPFRRLATYRNIIVANEKFGEPIEEKSLFEEKTRKKYQSLVETEEEKEDNR